MVFNFFKSIRLGGLFMKIKNGVLVNSVESLNALLGTKLSSDVSFIVAKNMKVISDVLIDVEGEKNKIISKWLERDKDGNPVKKDENNFTLKKDNKLNDEMKVLLEKEQDLKLVKLKESDLKGTSIEPGHLFNLTWMFDEK